MTAFEDFVNLELPKRATVLLSDEIGYTGDPNLAVNVTLNNAPEGRNYFWDKTNKALWLKAGPTSTDWIEEGRGFVVSAHADLATIPDGQLVVGREWEVLADGTKWSYTGSEASAPDPASEDAWHHTGPARYSWWRADMTDVAATRTVWCDDANGSDVFNDGSLAQPFQSVDRALAQIPDGFDRDIWSDNLRAATVVEVVPGAQFLIRRRQLDFRFARHSTDHNVTILGERVPIDLDGLGTTTFTPGANVVNLTGPNPSGGTITKTAIAQYDTGVVLGGPGAVLQDPPDSGTYFAFTESDFGLPGLRFFGINPIVKTHTPAELGASGLAGMGQSPAPFADAVVSPFTTPTVAGAGSVVRLNFTGETPRIELLALDFSANARLNSANGKFTLNGCRVPCTSAVTLRADSRSGFLTPFRRCFFAGAGGGSRVSVISNSGVNVQIFDSFINAAVLALQTPRCSIAENLVFRGGPEPLGGNNYQGRFVVGFDQLDSASATYAQAFTRSLVFERFPGDASPMPGDAAVAVGRGTQFTLTSDSSRTTSFDVAGRPFKAVFGATILTPSGHGYEGAFGEPALLRHGAHVYTAVANGTNLSVYGTVSNYVTPGNDMQYGLASAGSQVILPFASTLPWNDVQVGKRSGAVVGALDIESEGLYTR